MSIFLHYLCFQLTSNRWVRSKQASLHGQDTWENWVGQVVHLYLSHRVKLLGLPSNEWMYDNVAATFLARIYGQVPVFTRSIGNMGTVELSVNPGSWIVSFKSNYCISIIWNSHWCSLYRIFKIQWNRCILDSFRGSACWSTVWKENSSKLNSRSGEIGIGPTSDRPLFPDTFEFSFYSPSVHRKAELKVFGNSPWPVAIT